MLRWTDLSQIPQGYGPSVVTLGNFDGVHKGHRAVLSTVVQRARISGARAVAVTFEPHPVAVLHPERASGFLALPFFVDEDRGPSLANRWLQHPRRRGWRRGIVDWRASAEGRRRV